MTSMRKWDNLKYGDKISIKRLVNEYRLFSQEVFPYTSCKVRVWYDGEDGMYYAYGNIFLHDAVDAYDNICGIGKDENAALEDYLFNFLNLVAAHEGKLGRKLGDDDYGYCDPHEF